MSYRFECSDGLSTWQQVRDAFSHALGCTVSVRSGPSPGNGPFWILVELPKRKYPLRIIHQPPTRVEVPWPREEGPLLRDVSVALGWRLLPHSDLARYGTDSYDYSAGFSTYSLMYLELRSATETFDLASTLWHTIVPQTADAPWALVDDLEFDDEESKVELRREEVLRLQRALRHEFESPPHLPFWSFDAGIVAADLAGWLARRAEEGGSLTIRGCY